MQGIREHLLTCLLTALKRTYPTVYANTEAMIKVGRLPSFWNNHIREDAKRFGKEETYEELVKMVNHLASQAHECNK